MMTSDLCSHQFDTLMQIYNRIPLLGLHRWHLSFSNISCLFAEALDTNCCMFLIDCFQNICNKLSVPLSEGTTEGLV